MTWKAAWLASIALGILGCNSASNTDGQQVLTGSVGSTADAIAVRAVTGTTVVSAAEIASDGTFTLAVPVGSYRLEMLTASGVKPVVVDNNGVVAQLAFRVCAPGNPWPIGPIGGGSGSGVDDPPPPFCDPSTGVDSSGSACVGPGSGGDGGGSACYDAAGNPCPPPPPPCGDPTDPTTCQDPCMGDPTSCGCGSGDDDCWPAPDPSGGCDGGMTPTNPPGDFGCGSDSSGGGGSADPGDPTGGSGSGGGSAGGGGGPSHGGSGSDCGSGGPPDGAGSNGS